MPTPRFQHIGKRLFDLILVIPALILLAPLLGLVALLVRLRLGSPILFRQQRPGQYGQPFINLKFRTMTDARDARGNLLPDADRLTPLGRFLRRTSLDELPALFNVLRGEMSLVGPRPLLMKYLNRYDPEQMRRHEVKPGLTGWAQVCGRNALTWEEKLKFDVWYVDHGSLGLDFKIMLMTIGQVLKHEGVSHPGHVSMTEFKGAGAKERISESGTLSKVTSNPSGPEQETPMFESRPFSPEFKAQLVLELISGVRSVVQICREYGLKPQLLAKWQADLLENAPKAFQGDE